ncbi:MAG TPA: folylpolyglutamate synthase/dihydrofolate synthase family protein [Flavisolibacter sp.]|nr:folylpolyglutamate synthase/dihydrofolate synthase family protein [Flavisolibacter sp.]
MNYPQTLDYLYNKLPMFSRMGSAAYKKDLTNIQLLCEALGNPHEKFKSIHVAGTNGKGSVSHMLAAIFQTAGYKTGLYTSPHLYDFRERIRIGGAMISEDFVVDFVERIKPLIEKIEPSFFEITVAMAFEAFAAQEVDVAIIEVGLGGRLDSTNIITPELSIITNIGWDHMNMLGNSLEEIAGEKAGIIKEAVPVVVGETVPETKPVFEKKAKVQNAPLVFAEENFQLNDYRLHDDHLEITYKRGQNEFVQIQTDLPGIYQIENVRTVLAAVEILKKTWALSQTVVNKALQNVKSITGLMGRWDVLHSSPTIVLEVAHNKNGVEKMLSHLKQVAFNRLHIVIGLVKDKEVDDVLALLPQNASYYFTQAQIPRAMKGKLLQEKAIKYQLSGDVFNDVNQALQSAIQQSAKNDLIIVCGSIFLVAEVDKKGLPAKN